MATLVLGAVGTAIGGSIGGSILGLTFYPFLLMDVPPGNSLPDPYSDNEAVTGQPAFPWRGRITASPAAGFAGSVDKTSAAAAHRPRPAAGSP